MNPGQDAASVAISAVDDSGMSGGTVHLVVPGGSRRVVTAMELESGGADLEGILGKGMGKWRLIVNSDRPVQVLNLLVSPTGHMSNLSTLLR